ncbi:30S ribosomal protein S13 [Candidatus Woesearchaeota archaeon]|nr:30S ribosomal protein S13 [Candidatus Woesearchaeota archaeon]
MADEKGKGRYIVRIHNTDLNGEKAVGQALTKIKGVGKMFARAVCISAKVDTEKKAGLLEDKEIESLNEVVKNPLKFGIPTWMLNRRNDPFEGTDQHLLTSDLDFVKGNDIKHLQKIKAYKGMRHAARLPVRGQRTKSNFRRNKGKAASVNKAKIGK